MTTAAPSPASLDPSPRRHFILGTAGHIDHGKTSLVRALTGTDTDRLPEERRRGMTIELGFAELVVGGAQLGIVDVPGHERFVRTMVAGATGIDIALIVVAADDSVMPQTIEHVDVLHLLGVSRAVVAITKVDTVDAEMIELVSEDVRQLLSETAMADACICPVSSTKGTGIDELKRAIAAVCDTIELTGAKPPFRMAVDRVFTVQGRGTVVTGSVLRGALSEGDTLEVWPGGETCRVRGLQTHGAQFETLWRGQRAAVNISGIDRDKIARGAELATPGYLHPSRMIDARLTCLRSGVRRLKSTSVVRLEIGTCEVPVRVVTLTGEAIEPGDRAYVQLRSGDPITTAYGQRFIIRDENATRTIGGGVVLRPVGARRRHDPKTEADGLRALDVGDACDRVEQVLRRAGFRRPTELRLCALAGVELDDLAATLSSLTEQKRWVTVPGTDVQCVPAAMTDLGVRLTGWLERYHRKHPELPGRLVDSVLGRLERTTSRSIARAIFDDLLKKKQLKRFGRFVCVPAFAPALSAADEKHLTAMIEAVRAGGFQPPSIDEIKATSQLDRKRRERLLTLAVAMGELVAIDPKIYLHRESERALRERVAGLIRERQAGVAVAEVRETLASTRKFVVPFLEYLDRAGVTRRDGDQRVLVEPGGA